MRLVQMAETALTLLIGFVSRAHAARRRDPLEKTGLRDISSWFHFDRFRGIYNVALNFQLIEISHPLHIKISRRPIFISNNMDNKIFCSVNNELVNTPRS